MQKYKFYVKRSFNEDGDTYNSFETLYFYGKNYIDARYHAKCYIANTYRKLSNDKTNPSFRQYIMISKKIWKT